MPGPTPQRQALAALAAGGILAGCGATPVEADREAFYQTGCVVPTTVDELRPSGPCKLATPGLTGEDLALEVHPDAQHQTDAEHAAAVERYLALREAWLASQDRTLLPNLAQQAEELGLIDEALDAIHLLLGASDLLAERRQEWTQRRERLEAGHATVTIRGGTDRFAVDHLWVTPEHAVAVRHRVEACHLQLKLPAGDHQLDFVADGADLHRWRLQVRPGAQVEHEVTFVRTAGNAPAAPTRASTPGAPSPQPSTRRSSPAGGERADP